MRCILSARDYDPLGSVEVSALRASRWGRTDRRVNRIKTLDGGYALNDFGSAACDRDIRLVWQSDALTDESVARLVRLYAQFYCSAPAGFFLVAPSALETRNNLSQLDLLVLSQIA